MKTSSIRGGSLNKEKQKRKMYKSLEYTLKKNIFELYHDLVAGRYSHAKYQAFYIQDPKLRHIHKAQVRDRIVHQAVYSALTKIYEPVFVNDSYSCRVEKGTHKAVQALSDMARKMTRNYTSPCYALKCDIRKFFDSVDHSILLSLIAEKVKDERAMELFQEIVESFAGYKDYVREGAGIPIGNLTSQIFANIYLNELDQFVKHELREKFYARYADDFVILSPNKEYLQSLIPQLESFLEERLKMQLHPHKVELRNFYQGVDFLGYVLFPQHKILRTNTKHRMLKKMNRCFMNFIHEKIEFTEMNSVFQSYFGIMSHGNCEKLCLDVKKEYWMYSVLENDL